jgi:hypothetical protein
MDHRVDLLTVENLVQAFSVQDIPFHESQVLSADLPYPVDRFRAGIIQIVDYCNIIPILQKLHTGVASDKTCSSGNENSHDLSPLSRIPGIRQKLPLPSFSISMIRPAKTGLLHRSGRSVFL